MMKLDAEEIAQLMFSSERSWRMRGKEKLLALADENDRLRADNAELEGALQLSREGHQVTMDEYNDVVQERDRLRAERDEVAKALDEMSRLCWYDDLSEAANALLAKLRTP